MRELNTDDIFLLSKILDGIDVKLPEGLKDISGKENEERLGFEVCLQLAKKLHLVKPDVLTLLADLEGVAVEEIRKYPFKKMMGMLKKVFTDADFMSFFA